MNVARPCVLHGARWLVHDALAAKFIDQETHHL